jgi:homoserine dehydrogenase
MTTRLSIVQIGRGMVGATLIEQITAGRGAIRERLGVELVYSGIGWKTGGALEPGGLDPGLWRDAARSGTVGLGGGRALVDAAARDLGGPRVLVDATAADDMAPVHRAALQAGFHVVSCNKKPLAGSLADYRELQEAARAAGRLYLYEVTVGAGLPVIGTLRTLVDSGDRIRSIEGCFSGTLNYLCCGLDGGEPFSTVMARARQRGYTEPDPRDDLSGQDVARKALILAREAGHAIEFGEISLRPFCSLASIGDGSGASGDLDAEMEQRWREAARRGSRLRYVASVDGGCGASLREVPAESPLARLDGPENVFVFRSGRYDERALVVTGPGAGPAVTAAGALGDILKVARAVACAGDGGAT